MAAEVDLRRKKKREPSLLMAVARTIWRTMAMAAVLKLAQDLLGFVSPQILRYVCCDLVPRPPPRIHLTAME